ncbi:translocation/assembly module TamB domain-containing protein [Alcanivorax sp. 24]|uniref:translocation/assembly module TamB domain-containing protein n=1 Tax=Alcanivorax sp. 24 TaxID=2545266 RepID=UPI001061DCC1|nr:translocation/assembly module TamB domain-containing protein [Alcanivorax sp. 24]
MKRWRWLRMALLIMILLPLLLIAGVYGLLASRAGNLWVLEQVKPVLPGELTIEGWQGNLLGGAEVAHLRYRQDELVVDLHQLRLSLVPLEALRGWLYLGELHADQVRVHIPPSPADQQPDDTPFAMPESVALPLGVRIDTFSLKELILEGATDLQLRDLEGQQWAAWQRLNLPRIALTVADTRLDASLSGNLHTPFPAQGDLLWRRPAAGDDVAPQLGGRLIFRGDLDKLNISHDLSAPLTLSSNGSLAWRDQTLSLDLIHEWPAQALPVDTPVPVQLGAGKLTTVGTLDALDIQGNADLEADGHPLMLNLDATASTRSLALTTLNLDGAGQHLSASGSLSYENGAAWDLNVDGEALDPALVAPDWPGNLTLRARSKGHWRDQDWRVSVDPLSLTGTLRKKPVSLTGKASQPAGGDLSLTLTGRWGQDRITAEGKVGERLALAGTAAVADLSAWQGLARGALDLRWRLAGTLENPLLSGDLGGRQLAWEDWHLPRLDARFSNLTTGNGRQSLTLTLGPVSQGAEQRLQQLTLAVQGTRAAHRVTLAAHQDTAELELALQAALSQDWRWHGRIEQWRLGEPRAGNWVLDAPAPFSVSATRQQLETLCLQRQSGEGRLCLGGEHGDGGRFNAEARLARLPLTLFNPWLGDQLSLAGEINLDSRFSGTLAAANGEWTLSADHTRLIVRDTGQDHVFNLDTARLDGTLERGNLASQLALVVAGHGSLDAELNTRLSAAAPVDGRLRLDIPKLDDFAALIPQIGELNGAVRGELNLSGTQDAPRLSGQIDLTGGRASVPELGIAMEEITFTAAGDAAGLRLGGRARFGEGTLTLDGEWRPEVSPLAVTLNIDGERLKVANRPDAKVWVSPALRLQGNGQDLTLDGTLTVPEAHLEPRELPESAVSVSADQVIIDAETEDRAPLPFAMSVDVVLGDKVSFEGFGLTATLGGELRVSQKVDQPAQLNGNLTIKEGRYRAYGQNLAIDNGRLMFQGPPENPGLDILAIRKIPSESLVVGVRISGTLQQPKARIFSDPTLEESEAMSYLLTGRGLSNANQTDAAMVAQALAIYGLQGSGVTRKLSETLGLDEVTIGSDWGGTEDAALMLGKQISERLYLTYAVGIFDAISTVMLRYTLTRQLHLEAQSSSKNQALDLIWEKEFR